jgi:tetratricopeptide (TPR) repeat protein
MGSTYRQAGRFSSALSSYQRAATCIPDAGSHTSAEHEVFRAMLQWDVGMLARDQGDLDTAEAELRGALLVFRQHRGPQGWETSQIAVSLADVLRCQAEDLHAKARTLRHPLRRRELNRLYRDKVRLAAEQLSSADEVFREQSSGAPYRYATYLSTMGSLQYVQGRIEEALEALLAADRIFTETYGIGHPYRAEALSRLGAVLIAAGDRPGAADALGEAERLLRTRLGDEHPSRIAAHERLRTANG